MTTLLSPTVTDNLHPGSVIPMSPIFMPPIPILSIADVLAALAEIVLVVAMRMPVIEPVVPAASMVSTQPMNLADNAWEVNASLQIVLKTKIGWMGPG